MSYNVNRFAVGDIVFPSTTGTLARHDGIDEYLFSTDSIAAKIEESKE